MICRTSCSRSGTLLFFESHRRIRSAQSLKSEAESWKLFLCAQRSGGLAGSIAGAGAEGDAFARGADAYLAELAVARGVGRVIAEAVLRAQLVGDLPEGATQRQRVVGGHELAARRARHLLEVVVGDAVERVEHLR